MGIDFFIKIYTNMTHSHTCESHVDLNYSCRIASHFLRRELALHLTSHHRSRQCERSERRAHLPSLTFCRRLARRCQAHLSTSRTWSLFEFTLLSLKKKRGRGRSKWRKRGIMTFYEAVLSFLSCEYSYLFYVQYLLFSGGKFRLSFTTFFV